jgi:transposase
VDPQKKSLGASERDEEERSAWRECVRRFVEANFVEANELVFVDECGTNIALTRLYARAPKGERAYGKAPRNWGKNVTLIAAMSAQGMGASMSVEGATDGAAFQTYVEHFLLPTLKKGQVVLMANLQVHKSSQVRELIEVVGASVLFLPAYSPDFSPIEEAFSKIKGILRTIEARTHEALMEAIGIALEAVSRQDALSWFGHCGYDVTDQSL